MDQGFKGMRYFHSMQLHREAFGPIGERNVESLTKVFKNIGTAVSSKLTELRKSPSPTLVEEILKLEGFKDIKQHIVL